MVDLSETFYALLLTTLGGFMLTLLKYCYKSKCSSIDFCCIKIIRNTELEAKEESKSPENSEKV